MEKLEHFAQRLVEAFMADDLEEFHRRYDLPVTLIREFDTLTLHSKDELMNYVRPIRDLYMRKGLAKMDFKILSRTSFEPGMTLMSIAYDYLKADGTLINRLHTSYVLRTDGNRYRIAAHVTHNEYADRPAIEIGLQDTHHFDTSCHTKRPTPIARPETRPMKGT